MLSLLSNKQRNSTHTRGATEYKCSKKTNRQKKREREAKTDEDCEKKEGRKWVKIYKRSSR